MQDNAMTMTILENGRLFDGFSDHLVDPCHVLVEDDRIREVAFKPISIENARRIDCRGQTVMPGLIDAHVHACLPSSDFDAVARMPPSLLSQYGAVALAGYLKRGFTTVRDACGADYGFVMALERHLLMGPRLLISGKAISKTGGHGDARPIDQIDICPCAHCSPLTVIADGEDEVRRAVREELRKGAAQIKIFASGGVTSPTDPIWMRQFTPEEIGVAVYEASTRRTYVMAHCHTADSARACIAAGVRSIEHGSDLDEETAKIIAAAGSFVVPTLIVADTALHHGAAMGLKAANLAKLQGITQKMYRSIEVCARQGVKLGFGTDLPGNFGERQNEEFRLRATVQPSIDVLRSATTVNAALLGMDGEIGCVRAGAYADLLVVSGDPTRDVSVLAEPAANIGLIMTRGSLVKNILSP
jgi:imidazolonepropionase-like amidohydrolase